MPESHTGVRIRGRFRRSVNLERDFHETDGLRGYVVTARARELVGRVTDAMTTRHGQRAWSVMGPYGSGKSACALFAAHLARGGTEAIALLEDAADTELNERAEAAFEEPFCPVLIVGSRRPLAEALLEGLAHSLDAFADAHDEVSDTLTNLAGRVREAAGDADDEETARLYREAAEAVHETTGGGLFVVIDELGKLLEYAALHPEQSDLFVLQRLSEHAARPPESSDASAPMALLTILHQAFERYAGRLPAAEREEWRKVQGRFEDFAFVEPADETLRLLARAVETDDSVAAHHDAVSGLMDAARLPATFDEAQVADCLAEALPLAPAVSLIVGPLFRRLAQNERSLFAFLSAGEPHSFADVMQQPDAPPLYRLDHLYDYLTGAMGATLFNERMNRLWAETESALSRLETAGEQDVRLLKQIALLSFAGDLSGLHPTAELLRVTAGFSADDVDETLRTLKEARVVTYRPFHEEYHVWQGSDFNLEGKLDEAREEIPQRRPLANMLQDALPPLPVVARRHSYRTGATRVFEVIYASDSAWRQHLEAPHNRADGRIVYVLPKHEGDTTSLKESLREASAETGDAMTLLAVPDGIEVLHEAVRDLACFDWVLKHAEELQGDAAARTEVREQHADLAGYVHDQLTRLVVSDETGSNPCTWFYQGERCPVENERALQQQLSQICDDVFPQAPVVWNELVNRKEPSSSAVYGLKKLLEAMVEHGDEPRLGIDGYPAAYGLYASILEATGMHREKKGEWGFGKPSEDKKGCRSAWNVIAEQFEKAEGQRVSVQTFYDALTGAPHGVREGIIPVFLFAFYQHAGDEIAFYEDGSFIHDPSYAEIERFQKTPSKFAFQRVTIEDARADILDRLAPLVGLEEPPGEPLPVVIRLLRSVRDLPPYVRKTTRLSDEALAVREVLHQATEPATLLFEDLPEACGVESFLGSRALQSDRVFEYVERLQEALRELGRAYDNLIDYIEQEIARVFRLQAEDREARRSELAKRAQVLLPHVSEAPLSSFLVRATDEMMDTQSWYETLAALIAKRPPAQWLDKNRETFQSRLAEIAQQFLNQEPLYFEEGDGAEASTTSTQENGKAAPKTQRIRLSISAQNEPDKQAVVSIPVEKEDHVSEVVEAVKKTLDAEKSLSADLKLAALSKVAQQLLSDRADFQDSETSG